MEFKNLFIDKFLMITKDTIAIEWDFKVITHKMVAEMPVLEPYKDRIIKSFDNAHTILVGGYNIIDLINFLFVNIPELNGIKLIPCDINNPYATAFMEDEPWINCADGLNLPPARKRVIVTDGNIETQAWISATKGCWEGWAVLDNEYLNKIIAWRNFPKFKR